MDTLVSSMWKDHLLAIGMRLYLSICFEALILSLICHQIFLSSDIVWITALEEKSFKSYKVESPFASVI